MRLLRWVGLLLAAMTLPAAAVLAHDIPVDAVVRMFVRPQGQVLRVLVRMPLKCITDAEYRVASAISWTSPKSSRS